VGLGKRDRLATVVNCHTTSEDVEAIRSDGALLSVQRINRSTRRRCRNDFVLLHQATGAKPTSRRDRSGRSEPVLRCLLLWVPLFNDPIIAAEITADFELLVDRSNDTPAAGYTFGDFNETHLCVRQ